MLYVFPKNALDLKTGYVKIKRGELKCVLSTEET